MKDVVPSISIANEIVFGLSHHKSLGLCICKWCKTKETLPLSNWWKRGGNKLIQRKIFLLRWLRYNTNCNHIPHPIGDTFPLNKHSFPKCYENCCKSSSNLGVKHKMLPHFGVPFERMNSSNESGIDVSLYANKQPETFTWVTYTKMLTRCWC